METALTDLKNNQLYAMEWAILLEHAKYQWREFFDHIKLRAPEDKRVQSIMIEAVIEDPVPLIVSPE